MGVTPNTLAAWIRRLMIAADFTPEVDLETGAIGLTMRLKEEVPEHVFLNLRFELLLPVINLDEIEVEAEDEQAKRSKALKKRLEMVRNDSHCSKIHFSVDDVLAEPGSHPSYILRLVPIARDPKATADGARLQDNRESLETLVREMSVTGHPHEKGAKLEWRCGFNRVRFYHLKHREARDRVHFPNPRYVPLVASRLRGLVARLPTFPGTPADPGADERELEALIASADDAFSDPSLPKGPAQTSIRFKRESFGYDVYLIHGQDFEEFDLDRAIVETIKSHEAA